jgi:hypothetical protein
MTAEDGLPRLRPGHPLVPTEPAKLYEVFGWDNEVGVWRVSTPDGRKIDGGVSRREAAIFAETMNIRLLGLDKGLTPGVESSST